MKKLFLSVVLFMALSISANAQWFDFSENNERIAASFYTGLVGYHSVGTIGTDNLADVGVGMGLSFAGVYADFIYVNPDHRFDSRIIMGNWDDHDAFVLNVGYQIPIYKHYVFITPMIGWSRVSTGYTEGNNIEVNPDSYSIYHKYTSTWHRNEFNYGGIITGAPSKWFEISAAFTAHAVYGGVSFNLVNYQKR